MRPGPCFDPAIHKEIIRIPEETGFANESYGDFGEALMLDCRGRLENFSPSPRAPQSLVQAKPWHWILNGLCVNTGKRILH